jgi:hypothetical protein
MRVLVTCLVVLSSTVVPAQRSVGVIAGTVIDGTTRQAVGGATVTLAAEAATTSMMTTRDGRFLFRDLAGGKYSISASRPGYIASGYGKLGPADRQRPFELREGERALDLSIPLWPFGVIHGLVTDEKGQPVVGCTVRALRKRFVGAKSGFWPEVSGRTDDRGMYRFSNLLPGDYLLAVQGEPQSSTKSTAGYPSTFYPSVIAAGAATELTVTSGGELGPFDITITDEKMVRLSGLVRSLRSDSVTVVVTRDSNNDGRLVDMDVMRVRTDAQHRFSVSGLAPGAYTLEVLDFPRDSFGSPFFRIAEGLFRAEGTGPPLGSGQPLPATTEAPTLWARRRVEIGDRDLANVEIDLAPATPLRGRVVFDGARPEAARLLSTPVMLMDVSGRELRMPASRIEADGRLAFWGVPPGRYVLVFPFGPIGYAPVSLALNGRVLEGDVLDVSDDAASPELIVTMAEIGGTVSGSVVAADGRAASTATVILYPQDRRTWPLLSQASHRLRSTATSRDGRFMIATVPPGDYYVLAIDGPLPERWRTPEYLGAVTSLARKAALSRGQGAVLSLPVTSQAGRR